jgi:hypothetical protein
MKTLVENAERERTFSNMETKHNKLGRYADLCYVYRHSEHTNSLSTIV